VIEERSFEGFVADSVAGDSRGTELPEDFYAAMHDHASRTRQHPSWLALVKEPPMRISSRVAVGSPALQATGTILAGLLIAILIAAAGIAGQRLLAHADPIVVDQSGTGDFRTITEAVAAADEGSTILVRPGRYVESVFVTGKDLTIRGEGERADIVLEAASGVLPVDFAPASGEEAPDLPAMISAGRPYAWAMLLADTSTTLSNLTLIGQQVGTAIAIVGNDARATLEGIEVRMLGRPSGHWLSVNWAQGSSGSLSGSVVEGWLAVGPDTHVVIDHNVLPRTCVVAWDPGADIEIRSNTIHGCPYEKGIDVGNLTGPDEAAFEILIEDNDIWVEDQAPDASEDGYSGGRPAIEVNGVGSVRIVGNRIHDSLYGIVVDGGTTVEITGNRIHDNGVGVSGLNDDSRLSDNDISGNVTGVEIGFFSAPALERNTIAGNRVGLSIGGNSEPELADNIVCGNDISVLTPAGDPFEIDSSETCEDVPMAGSG
jgi:parallel beta-helix repeat protein